MKKALREFYQEIGCKKAYWLPFLILELGGFG